MGFSGLAFWIFHTAQGLRLRRVHLALTHFASQADVASLVRTQVADGKGGFRSSIPWPALPPVRTASTSCTSSRTPPGRSRWLLRSSLETFILISKAGFIPDTLTPGMSLDHQNRVIEPARIVVKNAGQKSVRQEKIASGVAEGEVVISGVFFQSRSGSASDC